MSIWLNILIDIGILSCIGLLYYFYQKKRIIKNSYQFILENLQHFRYSLNEYVEQMNESDNYQALREFSDQFEVIYQNNELESFSGLLKKQQLLSKELKNQLNLLNDQITDHLISR